MTIISPFITSVVFILEIPSTVYWLLPDHGMNQPIGYEWMFGQIIQSEGKDDWEIFRADFAGSFCLLVESQSGTPNLPPLNIFIGNR